MGQSSVWFATHLSVKWFKHANTKSQIKFSHHKAFIGVDDVEESEEDIHGDNFEGVKDDHADFHVARAVEARSCLFQYWFCRRKRYKEEEMEETSMAVLAAKK